MLTLTPGKTNGATQSRVGAYTNGDRTPPGHNPFQVKAPSADKAGPNPRYGVRTGFLD